MRRLSPGGASGPPVQPGSREHALASLTYYAWVGAAGGMAIAVTLAAYHRVWPVVAVAAVTGLACCAGAWRALLRLPRRAPR
jgi:hypothetical protein